MTSALSHHGLNAMNRVKAQTTKAERIPPIKYPAPTTKTLAEAQSIVDAEVAQKQSEYDALPEDDPRKIINNILYRTRPGSITLEE